VTLPGPRGWVVGASLLILTGANAYLVMEEEVYSLEGGTSHTLSTDDPLLGLRYEASQRRSNFAAFGLTGALLDRTLSRAESLNGRYQDKIYTLLMNAGDPEGVADALCGLGSGARPRYGALPYLVAEEGSRRPVDPGALAGITADPWVDLAPVDGVYEIIELDEERQKDATVMALAAILLGQEQLALEGKTPWGRGLLATWSFADVTGTYPGIDERVSDYLALLHVVVEVAQEEGGFCSD